MLDFFIKNKKITRFIFDLSLVFMFIMSASLMLASYASEKSFETNDRTPLLLSGLLFWISFIVAYALYFFVTVIRKKACPKSKKTLPGIVNFFSNPIAKIVDLIIIVSIIVLIVCLILTDSFITFFVLFLTVFFLQMHCVFNGKNYFYIKSAKNN